MGKAVFLAYWWRIDGEGQSIGDDMEPSSEKTARPSLVLPIIKNIVDVCGIVLRDPDCFDEEAKEPDTPAELAVDVRVLRSEP
jgi:hypothetical protein